MTARDTIRLHAELDQDVAYLRDMTAAIDAAKIQHGDPLPPEVERQVVEIVRKQLELGRDE